MILNDQSLNIFEFGARKAGARLQENRLEPELCFVGVAFDMNVWRFVTVTSVKEEAIRAGSKGSRHRSIVAEPVCMARRKRLDGDSKLFGKRGRMVFWWVFGCGALFCGERLKLRDRGGAAERGALAARRRKGGGGSSQRDTRTRPEQFSAALLFGVRSFGQAFSVFGETIVFAL